MAEESFFKKIGIGIGSIVGAGVGLAGGLVAGGVELVKSDWDWDAAGDKANKVMESCIEGGGTIGGECEGLIEAGLKAGATVAAGHAAKKLMEGNKDKDKQA